MNYFYFEEIYFLPPSPMKQLSQVITLWLHF